MCLNVDLSYQFLAQCCNMVAAQARQKMLQLYCCTSKAEWLHVCHGMTDQMAQAERQPALRFCCKCRLQETAIAAIHECLTTHLSNPMSVTVMHIMFSATILFLFLFFSVYGIQSGKLHHTNKVLAKAVYNNMGLSASYNC